MNRPRESGFRAKKVISYHNVKIFVFNISNTRIIFAVKMRVGFVLKNH